MTKWRKAESSLFGNRRSAAVLPVQSPQQSRNDQRHHDDARNEQRVAEQSGFAHRVFKLDAKQGYSQDSGKSPHQACEHKGCKRNPGCSDEHVDQSKWGNRENPHRKHRQKTMPLSGGNETSNSPAAELEQRTVTDKPAQEIALRCAQKPAGETINISPQWTEGKDGCQGQDGNREKNQAANQVSGYDIKRRTGMVP